MGADDFFTEAVGNTAEEAFDLAVEEAAWEYGHGGYTGTIAEKSSFVVLIIPNDMPEVLSDPLTLAEFIVSNTGMDITEPYIEMGYYDTKTRTTLTKSGTLTKEQMRWINSAIRTVEDKWGPAGCFYLGDNRYLFFGLASS